MIDVQEYAKALFLIAEEEGSTDTVLEDVRLVCEVLSANAEYVKLLDTPALPKSEKLSLIDGAFGTVDGNLKNLIKILCERHSIFAFSRVSSAYSELYDASRGIVRASAVSAYPMSEVQIAALSEKLSAITQRTVIVKNTVDKSILGGIKLRYEGTQLDGSVKTRLESFERRLKGTVI